MFGVTGRALYRHQRMLAFLAVDSLQLSVQDEAVSQMMFLGVPCLHLVVFKTAWAQSQAQNDPCGPARKLSSMQPGQDLHGNEHDSDMEPDRSCSTLPYL